MSATTMNCSHRASTAAHQCFRAPAAGRAPRSRPLRQASRAQRLDIGGAYFDETRPKGYDRPWIRADSQPLMAPRSQELSGDPFGMLLKQRIVFMGGEVEDFMADAIISQLLLLDAQDPTKDIKIFINSPGGSVTAGMGIYDAMMLCRADVQTYCFGLAASMGAFLLGAGKRGKRHSMPNARIMIHQPLGGASGQAVDIEIQAKEIMYHKANINRIMADYTNQSLSKIEEDTDRDRYMSPLEARDYGVIDHIVGGDQATFRVQGSTYAFPRVREDFITDFEGRDPLFGKMTPSVTGGSAQRFRRKEMEPYMPGLAPGRQWWQLKDMSDSDYKEMLEKNKDAGWIKEKVVDPDNDVWVPPKVEAPKPKVALPPAPPSEPQQSA